MLMNERIEGLFVIGRLTNGRLFCSSDLERVSLWGFIVRNANTGARSTMDRVRVLLSGQWSVIVLDDPYGAIDSRRPL
jgi:hypothetical protein